MINEEIYVPRAELNTVKEKYDKLLARVQSMFNEGTDEVTLANYFDNEACAYFGIDSEYLRVKEIYDIFKCKEIEIDMDTIAKWCDDWGWAEVRDIAVDTTEVICFDDLVERFYDNIDYDLRRIFEDYTEFGNEVVEDLCDYLGLRCLFNLHYEDIIFIGA